MSWTPEKNGFVPAAPIRRVVEQWATENWQLDERQRQDQAKRTPSLSTTALLAMKVGCHIDTISHLRAGKNNWIEFDLADRIVSYLGGLWLWLRDEELRGIYMAFDFTHLDIARPPSEDADDLALLHGVSDRTAATILGVSQSALNRQRCIRRRREKVAA